MFYDQHLHQIRYKSPRYIFHLKGEIHSFAWSTTKFLYDIREPRYKQIKIGYQILKKKLDIGQSRVLKSHVPYYFPYFFGFIILYRNGSEHETCLTKSTLKEDISQPPRMFIAREIMHKSRQYQISRHKIFQYSNILKSDTPFYFTYISAPEYRTEKFLYSRRSYGSHLSNELCPSLLACL